MRPPGWFSPAPDDRAVSRVVEAFEASFGSGRPCLERFWAGLGAGRSLDILSALIKVEFFWRFERGERPRVLEYLDKFSILTRDSERVISLVYNEFCLLQEAGENPDSRAFCRDYARWGDSLSSQLVYHRDLSRAVGQESPSMKFPEPGEAFGKYRLTSLLGVGGVARVYLANDEELKRPLAIKVSESFGQEPSILAKLNHRHIVQILTVAESDSGLRGICMPYRPGPTLEGVSRRIGRGTPPRTARALVDALGPRDPVAGGSTPGEGPGWTDFPVDKSYPEGVAWIGLCLAEALSYVHEQGIFHRDIKPANILLAHDDGPQLLDFNLAENPDNSEGASAAQKGGTLPYMAPEQLRAFLDPDAWGAVGKAADLYSLGLVLRELLTGRPPELPTSRGSLAREIRSLLDRRMVPAESIRDINPGVPPALESIVVKCLATRPEDRYRDASDLGRDLGRFLRRKPLLKAPNTSKFERGFNWAHRNHHSLGMATACVGFVTLCLGLLGPPAKAPKEARPAAGPIAPPKAELWLDSGRPEDLPKALAGFEEASRHHPDSARPLLGLALTLRKMGSARLDGVDDPSAGAAEVAMQGRINDLLRSAVAKVDAEEAFEDRLAKEPGSPTLLVNLGFILSNKRRFDEARQRLEEALRLDPEGILAHVALSEIEQMTQRHEAAAFRLTQSVKLATKKKVGARTIHGLRLALLHTLVKLIDRDLEAGDSNEALSRATAQFKLLRANFGSFEAEGAKLTEQEARDEHAFAIPYLEGCLASIGGVLEPRSNDERRPGCPFARAEVNFASARDRAATMNRADDRLQQVMDQENKLATRRELAKSCR